MDEIEDYLQLKDENSKLHVSFDIDACCSSYILGTGTRASFGLSMNESLYIMQRIHQTKKLVNLDMVEVNVDEEIKILKEIYGSEKLARKNMKTLNFSIDLILHALGSNFTK